MPNNLDQVIQSLKDGGFALIIDDLDPKEPGYLFSAAELSTRESVNKLIALARGVVIAPITELRLRELNLHPSQHQQETLALAVEARFGVSTGVSSADRAQTLRILASTTRARTDLVIPGHIFPHMSKEGGVLVRAAASEAATDLLQKAGLAPVAALSRCLNTKGSSLNLSELKNLAAENSIPFILVSELLCDRLANESLVEQITTTRLPLEGMEKFSAIPFRSKIDGAEHLALILGDIYSSNTPPLVRVQSEERISDLFGFGRVDSRNIISRSLAKINEEGSGVFIYIRHPRRGIVAKQVKELGLEAKSSSTRAGALREYGVGTQILKSLGINSLRLLSTKVRPIYGVENFQIKISSQVAV